METRLPRCSALRCILYRFMAAGQSAIISLRTDLYSRWMVWSIPMRGAGKVLFAAAASILPWTHWAAGAPELYLNESFQGAARLVQSLPDTAAWFSATDSSHVVHDPSQGTLTLLSAPSA